MECDLEVEMGQWSSTGGPSEQAGSTAPWRGFGRAGGGELLEALELSGGPQNKKDLGSCQFSANFLTFPSL